MITALRHGLPRALRNLVVHWRASLNSILILCASLVVLGLIVVLYLNVLHYSEAWLSNTAVSLFLEPDLQAEQREELLVRVRNHPLVRSAALVSPESGLEGLAQRLGANHALLAEAGAGVLPYTLDFELFHDYRQHIGTVAQQFAALPGVEDVVYTERLLGKVELFFRITKGIGLFLIGLILLSVYLVVAHTTRLSLYARREEIEILDLVGATRGFIRASFVVEGMLVSLGGAGLALGLVYFCLRLALAGLSSAEFAFFDASAAVFIAPREMGAALAVVMLLAAFSSGRSVTRMLRELEP